jgi:transposase-like protein
MEIETIIVLLLGIGLLWLCIHVRHWRSETFAENCPKCGTRTKANGSSSGLMQGGRYLHNYKCPNCGYKWMN